MSNARNIASIAGEDVLNASNEIVPVYACRAWVNFDGTTNTAGFCTIRDSGNVSSVADVATARYRVNFETNLPHANYVVAGSNLGSNSNNYYAFLGSDTSVNAVDHFSFYSIHNSGAVAEMNHLQLLVIG